MLNRKKMEYSRGDDQWLGDGIYLYQDKIYAFRWITIKFKEKFDSIKIADKLFEQYMILRVNADYKHETVFSFLNPEHVLEFKEVKKRCKYKKGMINRLREYEFTDGVVINFMFKNMDYGKNYDMVEAVFPLEKDPEETDTRLPGMNEYQLCVKDPDKIIDFSNCSSEFDYDEYHEQLNKINAFRTRCNEKYHSKTRTRGVKYGK